ncbi:hypothetical protein Bca52824_082722 [Brassica carinata]|uniref:Uncharacterized protein n=1 Tax=Brassica carinata TaxID=52824 RepID=A0A8X7TT64_BRACI|nr:hypothetical protein Bca52824_082722 [Brassica carinata]
MHTRYMERTNSMREKRQLEEDDNNNQQSERKRPALASVIVEALKTRPINHSLIIAAQDQDPWSLAKDVLPREDEHVYEVHRSDHHVTRFVPSLTAHS